MNDTDIEAIYELSPMQQGMLFDSLYDTGSGGGVVQLSCRLRGEMDVPAFRSAWQQVVERHARHRAETVDASGNPFRDHVHRLEVEEPEGDGQLEIDTKLILGRLAQLLVISQLVDLQGAAVEIVDAAAEIGGEHIVDRRANRFVLLTRRG